MARSSGAGAPPHHPTRTRDDPAAASVTGRFAHSSETRMPMAATSSNVSTVMTTGPTDAIGRVSRDRADCPTRPESRCRSSRRWDVLIRQVEGERGGESAILDGRGSGEVLEQVDEHELLVGRQRLVERLQLRRQAVGRRLDLGLSSRRHAFTPFPSPAPQVQPVRVGRESQRDHTQVTWSSDGVRSVSTSRAVQTTGPAVARPTVDRAAVGYLPWRRVSPS